MAWMHRNVARTALALGLVLAAGCSRDSETPAPTGAAQGLVGRQVTIRRAPDMCQPQWSMSVESRIWTAIENPRGWADSRLESTGAIDSIEQGVLTYVDADGTSVRFERLLTLGPPCS